MGSWDELRRAQAIGQQQQMNAAAQAQRPRFDALRAMQVMQNRPKEPIQIEIRDVTDEKPPVLLLPPASTEDKA